MFHNVHIYCRRKIDKNFFDQIFQNIQQVFPPMGPKFQFLKKMFPTIFFTHKICFTEFRIHWRKKNRQKTLDATFEKNLQVIFQLWDQYFNVGKMCPRQIFYSQNMLKQHFTSTGDKKLISIF